MKYTLFLNDIHEQKISLMGVIKKKNLKLKRSCLYGAPNTRISVYQRLNSVSL